MKTDKCVWGVVLLVAWLAPSSVHAQGAPAVATLTWTQPAASRDNALSYTYQLYPDAATIGTPVTAVTCTALQPTMDPTGQILLTFACTGRYAPLGVGSHAATLSATGNGAESVKTPFSDPIVVTAPDAPRNPKG